MDASAALSLDKCSPSKLAGSPSQVLDDDPSDVESHKLMRRVVGILRFCTCAGLGSDAGCDAETLYRD